MDLKVRQLRDRDIEAIFQAFSKIGWNKPASQYRRYLREQGRGERTVLVAFDRDEFAGYVTVAWRSEYQEFREREIPEVQDLNVLPHFRRRRIATCLMDEVEGAISERSPVAGIGVGMTKDYGFAQRMYILRGYVPDGNGLMSHGGIVAYSESVKVDDDLVLYFTKEMKP